MSKNNLFKWVDETFTDEIQKLEIQVRVLEEELEVIKATVRIEGPNNGRIVVGCCLIPIVLVLGI